MIAIAQRPQEKVEALLANAFQCVTDRSGLASATAAEHIRAVLYGASVAHQDAASTVHTRRLLTNARRATDLTWPHLSDLASAEGDLCASTLQHMKLLGDVVDTGRGQWLAAPMRIVAPNDATHCLVLGSAPAPVVQNTLGAPITCGGASRFVSAQILNKREQRDLLQSVDAWLGDLQPLSVWTAQVLASHEERLEELRDISPDQLELYAPDILRSQRRPGRWISAIDIGRPVDGIRLVRPRGGFARDYDRPHYLAYFGFKDGELSLRSCASVAHDLTLRLRFGLDLLLKTPRQFSITASPSTFAIDRPSALPHPEKCIYALGWNDYFADAATERLTFHNDALPFVLHALQRLSITPTISRRSMP